MTKRIPHIMATNRIASSFIHEQNDRLITASAITNNATEDVELADPKDDTKSAEKERKRIRGLVKKLIIQLVVFILFFCILWDSFEGLFVQHLHYRRRSYCHGGLDSYLPRANGQEQDTTTAYGHPTGRPEEGGGNGRLVMAGDCVNISPAQCKYAVIFLERALLETNLLTLESCTHVCGDPFWLVQTEWRRVAEENVFSIEISYLGLLMSHTVFLM